jgi:hypothetical protein
VTDLALLLAHAAATLYMTGLIWFVQVVHYPLMSRADRGGFPEFERAHQTRTTWVVAPGMLAEAAAAVWIVLQPPPGVPAWTIWTGGTLLAGVWASTFLLQVPRHERLSRGFDEATHRGLVRTNWIRTFAWSARAVLALRMIASFHASIPDVL